MKFLKRASSTAAGLAIAAALVIVPTTSASAATTCVKNVYGYGGYSTCIGDIQKILNMDASNFENSRLKIDNSFGNLTVGRVKEFQSDHKLAQDGWVGPATWKALCGVHYGYGPAYLTGVNAQKAAGC